MGGSRAPAEIHTGNGYWNDSQITATRTYIVEYEPFAKGVDDPCDDAVEAGEAPSQQTGRTRGAEWLARYRSGLMGLCEETEPVEVTPRGRGTGRSPRSDGTFISHAGARPDRYSFKTGLRTGAGLTETDAVLRLREGLLQNNQASRKMSRRVVLAPIFKAWNAHYGGREVKVLSLRYRGTGPEPSPSCSGSTDWISRCDSPCRDPMVRNRVP